MKNNSDKTKTASRNNGLLSHVAKYGIVLALIVFAFVAMHYVNNMSLNNITTIFGNSDEHKVDNRDDIYNSLLSFDRYSDYNIVHNVTPEELTLIISEFTLPAQFEMTVQKTHYSSDNTLSQIGIFSYADGEFAMNNFTEERLISTITGDGFEIVYTDELSGRSKNYQQTDNFSFEEACELASLEYLTDKCTEIANGSSSADSYDLSLIAKNDKSLYKAVLSYSDIGQREEYYVDVQSEMIVAAYSYIEDVLIYSYEITSYIAA